MAKPRSLFDDTTRPIERQKNSRPLAAILRATGVRAKPPFFRLDSGTCTVGSASTADFVLEEPTVSRHHCELELVPEGVLVTDLGSRNGTYYLGQKLERAVLSLGATLNVGSATLILDADAAELKSGEIFDGTSYGELTGSSMAMRRIFSMLARLSGSLVPILVEGESGVGKEVLARTIHADSRVAKNPLVIVNCGALPRELIASELFGHARGAFTGANEARRGAFESADGGTLFLDEIGELPLDMQPTLLRTVESGEIRRVGSDEVRRVQVRVLAATNRNLEEEVMAGRFREDLFYRLAVVRITVPSLSDRREDIEPLAREFAKNAGIGELEASVIEQLKARPFPGNVRELRNAVLAYAALGVLPATSKRQGSFLDVALADLVDVTRPYAEQKEELSERFTKAYLRALIAHTKGNQTAAARLAGLDRSHLGKLLQRHGTK